MGDEASRTEDPKGTREPPPSGRAPLGQTIAEEAKFQLGRPPLPFDGIELPWSYGDNRITAMVRSPDSLFVYWEITDEGIADARSRLGGAAGGCNLRFYDTTSRAFDGINANAYFDVRVERHDREYFIQIGRPTSSFHVEIGIMSHEGYFQPIARSGRADFPRKGPSPDHSLEWMTVMSDDPHPAARPYTSRYIAPPGGHDAWSSPSHDGPHGAPSASGPDGAAGSTTFTWLHPGFTEVHWEGPWITEGWRTEWRLRWVKGPGGENVLPIEAAQWVVGPFPIHLLEGGRLEIRFLGDERVILAEQSSGLEVFGPWEVRIQSFAIGGERRQLASWRVHWARVEPAKVERWWTALERVRTNAWQRTRAFAMGASESQAVVELGASEMWRMGASERWSIGASEWEAMGGSEAIRASASELLYRGASGIAWGGASGMVWGGVSERAWGGASEWMYGGKSGWSPGGASEHLGGSSARVAHDAEWLAKRGSAAPPATTPAHGPDEKRDDKHDGKKEE